MSGSDSEVSGHSETIASTLPEASSTSGRGTLGGYQLGELLGRGGMGEVLLADDLRIGRKVAVKRMRAEAPSSEAVERFMREAKIQARLDHPAIVPVHELGRDAEGRPFFTMKRLSGSPLVDVLASGDAKLQTLLRAFVDICLAIDFAHAHGVIHRDLKPANVMLGGYGEVYVLDWGVARVVGETVDNPTAIGIASLDGHTQAGAVLGTPGYMSPEQLRGDDVGLATDIYALGAILFEILAGVPAHPRGAPAMASTLAGALVPPAERAPDRGVPPELDALCAAALADAAAARPTARTLADDVQRYLDGDRDLALRRTLAATELGQARAAVVSGDPARRGEAMRAAGRALSLDPASEAAELVTQLTLEPPSERDMPAPLLRRLEATDDALVGTQARLAWQSTLVYMVFLPAAAIGIGVNDWRVVAATLATVVVIFGGSLAMNRYRRAPIYWALIANATLLVLLERYISPLILVPGLIAGTAVALIVFPSLLQRPVLVIGTFVIAYLVPFLLEATGVWSSTFEQVGDAILVRSAAMPMTDATMSFLVLSHLAMLIVLPLFVRTLAIAQRDGRRRLEVYAWHLDQLLPAKPQPQ
ncbi:MAG: serine/threonine-protein kinase [Kofleriaceae bacterium]